MKFQALFIMILAFAFAFLGANDHISTKDMAGGLLVIGTVSTGIVYFLISSLTQCYGIIEEQRKLIHHQTVQIGKLSELVEEFDRKKPAALYILEPKDLN